MALQSAYLWGEVDAVHHDIHGEAQSLIARPSASRRGPGRHGPPKPIRHGPLESVMAHSSPSSSVVRR